ncbi:Uncharacterised protein [Mycolicibacterium phlei]|uniref:DUF7882 family protein n=1 Tax=Mycobacteroides chelonae TaxID=1774 RepID=UPI000618C8EE|nr:hypothetical protein [Mycobacteroides chelonae]VEG16088.1 Uncharacterised protein [Mycolicibacterium phlei]AKC38712.1 hypothetical protein GR01_09245 [Mycobacteroides chelonae]ANB00900.1 hypothetical protein BB28_09760 [Mycobacteroides chelonae CCUG 47445]OLT78068.1 hypothetical protein BKG56_13880 [Mycobacteroides chelonae]ORV15010.1 hypothetical protein AWB96_10845 [Mycobacteroides chelonae]
MAAQLFIDGNQVLNTSIDQLAHLQYVLSERFKTGQGLFLTVLGGTNNGRYNHGQSLWLHPSQAISFTYGPRRNDRPIDIDQQIVTRFLSEADTALGIIINEDGDDAPPPFDAPSNH